MFFRTSKLVHFKLIGLSYPAGSLLAGILGWNGKETGSTCFGCQCYFCSLRKVLLLTSPLIVR